MTTEGGPPATLFSDAVPELLQSHFDHLSQGSGISPEVVSERRYKSCLGRTELAKLGFTPSQQRVPGLLIPLWSVDGSPAGCQYRPDNPRINPQGRPIKYESPRGSGNRLDCPPRCQKLLGDPKTPLWITEGSKKADALASHGVCAISITGVWGFKGKNEHGAVTILADWDHLALKGRTVYLTFDSDVVTKPSVKKALNRLAEHLKRKGAETLVIHLPQNGDEKVGIDDYLLTHSIEDALKLATELEIEIEAAKPPEAYVPGFVLPDGTIGELVVNHENDRSFIVVEKGSVRQVKSYATPKVTYLPTDDVMVGEVVHFAATATPYDSQARLFADVRAFVNHYLELPEDFEDIVCLYVLLSWVYEFAPSMPYLRVIGDWGTGKTRFLQVVGSICFRPMFASGATTPAPIFRILEQFRGTLVFDEADFKDSSSQVDMIKLLNNGYRPNMPVLRADKENGKWFPRSYRVFGPKLIATRYPFKDEALESRCLTAEMAPLSRDDIPRILPPSFDKEVNALRAKLLTFRLANLTKLKGKTFGNELLEPNLQPRLQEILIPLKAMLNGDQSMVEVLTSFVRRLQESLFARRREGQAGRVIAAMIELHKEQQAEITSKSIADRANEMDEEAQPLTSEKVGWLTRSLGLKKARVAGSGRRVICWDEDRIKQLAARHGLSLYDPLSDTEPSQLSHPSQPGTGPRCDGFLDHDGSQTKPSQGFEPVCDSSDGCDSPSQEIREIEEKLGMSIPEVLTLWENYGRPPIYLGPGEKCLDLKKLLGNRKINKRHLSAVVMWLNNPQIVFEEDRSKGINPMTGR